MRQAGAVPQRPLDEVTQVVGHDVRVFEHDQVAGIRNDDELGTRHRSTISRLCSAGVSGRSPTMTRVSTR